MPRTLTDWLPGLSEPIAKEHFSFAHFRCLAAQAGIKFQTINEYDDGIDAIAGSDSPIIPGFPRLCYIFFQFKSTTNWRVENNNIIYSLKQDNYNKLRVESNQPQYLVLHLLPRNRETWAQSNRNALSLYGKSFCHSLLDYPENDNANSTTISIPLSSRLTLAKLMNLYHKEYGR